MTPPPAGVLDGPFAAHPARWHDRGWRRRRPFILAPVLVYLAVAVAAFSAKPLSRDEMVTYAVARLPLGRLVESTRHVDAAFLPYYALMHLTPDLAAHPVLLRVWSLLAGAVTVALTTSIAAMLWGRRWGLSAGVLLGVNGIFIASALTARSPAIATALVVLATWLLVRSRADGPSRRTCVLYALAMGVAGWFTMFALLVMVAHAVVAIVWWWRLHRRRLAGAALGAAGAVLLVVPLMLSARKQGGQIGWITERSFGRGVWLGGYLSGSTVYYSDAWDPRFAVPIVAVGLAVVLVAVRGRRREDIDGLLLGLVLFLVPLALLWLLSNAVRPLEIPRYAVGVSSGYALIVTGVIRAAAQLQERRPARTLAVAVALLVTMAAQFGMLRRQYTHTNLDNYPRTVRRLNAALRPGEQVAFVQGYAATGPVAGIAVYSGDRSLFAAVEHALPHGVRQVFFRRVVHVDPLRTVAEARPHGLVEVIATTSGSGPGSASLYWAGALRRAGCRQAGPPARPISRWTCA